MALTADRKERLTSLAGVALLHLVLGWALLVSFAPTLVRSVSDPIAVFNVRETPPPPPPEQPPEPEAKREPQPVPAAPAPDGAAAPPAARRAALTVTPSERVLDRDVSPAEAAGLIPASGRSGMFNSESQSDGAGSGKSGSGSGSGSAGSGSGSGGTGVATVRPRLRGGNITRRDYPKAANGNQGVVEARLNVSAAGVVTTCTISRSSGNAVLDATTCQLIRQRFRFDPARDAQGNAVPYVQGWQQRWWRD